MFNHNEKARGRFVMYSESAIERFEPALIVYGLMKLVVLAFFFASFAWINTAPAQETNPAQCEGVNLLQKLEQENPETYQQVLEEAGEIKNSGSIFWKIEKDGQKPSWLIGTMHLSDPEIAQIDDDAKQAILKSDYIVIESVEALDEQAAAKAMAGLGHLTLLTEGTLRDLVEDDLEDELEEAVTARGIPMALADRMQPWLIATTISLPICEIHRKQKGEIVLDSVLAKYATGNGLELRGLETVKEQLTAIATLPMDYHVSALEETLESGNLAVDMIETMKALYKQGDMSLVFPIMKAVMPKSSQSEGLAQFQEALIDKRNKIMFERSLPFMENGSAFIAVGALHLPGDEGLVELFREAGYTVTSQR